MSDHQTHQGQGKRQVCNTNVRTILVNLQQSRNINGLYSEFTWNIYTLLKIFTVFVHRKKSDGWIRIPDHSVSCKLFYLGLNWWCFLLRVGRTGQLGNAKFQEDYFYCKITLVKAELIFAHWFVLYPERSRLIFKYLGFPEGYQENKPKILFLIWSLNIFRGQKYRDGK